MGLGAGACGLKDGIRRGKPRITPGVGLPLPARNERERVGERGNPIETQLLSPALSSSSVGREGEERSRFSKFNASAPRPSPSNGAGGHAYRQAGRRPAEA